MGGTVKLAGDIVVMDADGSITVRASRLDEILEKSEARAAKEEAERTATKTANVAMI